MKHFMIFFSQKDKNTILVHTLTLRMDGVGLATNNGNAIQTLDTSTKLQDITSFTLLCFKKIFESLKGKKSWVFIFYISLP